MKIKFLQRQRTLRLVLVSLLMTAGIAIANAQAPTGAINGVFSVDENTVVYFSQGNLHYKASTNKWQFATHQYDYIGSANSNISSTYTGWIDLFGWGTSGYHDSSDPYNVNYQPWSTSYATVYSDYNYYGYGPSTNMSDPNLTGSSANYDWGVYNAISNGGNTASTWRTLTQPEWYYLFFTRATASGIRYSKATVNGVNGVILLPDDWSADYYTLSNTNTSGASFSSNVITASQWATLEQHGAVFLPAAGYRHGTSVGNVGSYGNYWSASYGNSDYACRVHFGDGSLSASYYSYRHYGQSVRLVCPVENYSIHATPSPSEGGAVSGAGAYAEGAECTLTATASAGYTFAYWTEGGEVVSTDAEYTFTVTGDRTLVANFTQNGSMGKLNGHFSVGENTMVFFSQGNLQYRASTNTWRFAENQWDFVGSDNSNISQTYSGLIDLFGWGTSEYNHGANCYQPWSTSTSNSDYYAYGNSQYNLFDQTGKADWGYNAISNGGNTENSGWRTLTRNEWDYLFNTRSTSSGIRYSKATVNGVNGVILLPDDWSADYYTLSNTNTSGANFSSNVITASQWATLEQHGAVFLPAAGIRNGTSVNVVGSYGNYWSASYYNSDYAYYVNFYDGYLRASFSNYRCYGQSVRLVCPVENYSLGINAIPSPSEGGAVSGAGAYQAGAECTLTATASAGYTFAYWTQNGRVVSADASYTFTVGGNRDLVAVFAPNVSTGNLHGQFTVGENAMVCFSQGNLQYKASSNTWRFAENQWDYVGADNKYISSDYNGLTDLFGWGTSGYNHGATCYQPWSTSANYSDYYAYGNSSYNLFDQTGQADWGYNAISNGGDSENSGWRTLTRNEWNYLFNTRSTSSGIRYAKATVNSVNGVILLPDDWSADYYTLSSTNTSGASFSSNIITAVQWNTLEQHGAVFLPAAGSRYGTSVDNVGSYGYYWSASYGYSYLAYYVSFSDGLLNASNNGYRLCGLSVRLVCPVENYSIHATPSPSEGGAVSGAGAYQTGAECTLTATASAGYTFVHWIENGEVVSTDSEYTFTVSADRDLVANFSPLHWSPESSAYEDFMAVIGVVQIDGVEQTSTAFELGAFCGDECRGTTMAAYFPPTQRYLYQLPVFGNNGDVITFKLYDHAQQQELDLSSETQLTINDSGYGSLANPQVINFISTVAVTATVYPEGAGTVEGTGDFLPGTEITLIASANEGYAFNSWTENSTVVSTAVEYTFTVEGARHLTAVFDRVQTTALGNGWNWYSTYIEQDGINGLEQLEESLGSNGLLIKSRSGLMVENYDGSYWWGGLTAIDNSQMYEIKTSQACEVSMQGQQAQASQHPATIKPGWNWIGYPCDTEMSIEQAMSSLSPNEDDMVKSHTGFSSYFPNWGWYGLLETLEPGQGYKYNSKGSANQSLVYPDPSKDAGHTTRAVIKTHFENHGLGCRDNMSVMATVSLDGMELSGERYELAAFVGGMCRGSVKLMYVEPLHGDVAFLTVLGEANDAVTFRLYDEETGLTYEAEEGVAFEADAVLGNQHERFPVTFKSTALAATRPLLFPNPVGRGERVFVENVQEGVVMEVVNQLGVTLKTVKLAGANTAWDCDLVPGVYTVRILKDQQTLSVEKLIVK